MDTFAFKLLTFLHILSVIVAFAPAFVWPVVTGKLKRSGAGPDSAFAMAAPGTPRIYGPALVLAGVFGFGLVGVSDGAIGFGEAWISVAMLLWFIMLGVVFALQMPAQQKAANGDAGAVKLAAMATGILHLLLVVMLIVMIWQPGR